MVFSEYISPAWEYGSDTNRREPSSKEIVEDYHNNLITLKEAEILLKFVDYTIDEITGMITLN